MYLGAAEALVERSAGAAHLPGTGTAFVEGADKNKRKRCQKGVKKVSVNKIVNFCFDIKLRPGILP